MRKMIDLKSPIYMTAVRKHNKIFAERYTNHARVANNNDLVDVECGFLNKDGLWLDRKEAFVVALYNNQVNEEALKFLAQRLAINYDLRETHYGLDSMWLKTDGEGNILVEK